MPVAVKDYTWDQTDCTLFITLPLKGVKPNKVDVFSTERYLKVCQFINLIKVFFYRSRLGVASLDTATGLNGSPVLFIRRPLLGGSPVT